VHITVCPCLYICVSNTELSLGFFPGFKTLNVDIFASPHINPLEIVLLFHRVRNGADFDEDPGYGFLNYRNVFLFTLVNSLFLLQDHRFPATDQDSTRCMDNLGDVSAYFTLVHFKHFRHNLPSFLTRGYYLHASLRCHLPAARVPVAYPRPGDPSP